MGGTCMAKRPAKKAVKGKSSKSGPAEFTKDQELKAYRDMLLIRRFEEKAGQLYGMGFIGGFGLVVGLPGLTGLSVIVVGVGAGEELARTSRRSDTSVEASA